MAVQTHIAEDVADFIRKQSEARGVPFESELDAVLNINDGGFGRFPGLLRFNPLR